MCTRSICDTHPGPGLPQTRPLVPSICRLEVAMRIPRPPQWLRSRLARVSSPRSSSPMSSRQRRASHPAWQAVVNRSARTPVSHDPTLQQPTAKTQSESPTEKHSDHQPRRWRFWVSSINDTTAHPPTSRARARPDIMTTPGGLPPLPLAQHQTLSTPSAAGTHGPAPATRERVVLLPHTRPTMSLVRSPDERFRASTPTTDLLRLFS